LLAVRRFLELRERLLEREADIEREELLLGALGAAARRRAFLAFRRDTLRFLDFFGARGLLAVLRRDLDREDFLLEPRGAAARRRFFEDRLLDLEREREVDIERGLDREEAALGLLAVRRFLELRERLLEREADIEREELLLGALGAAARRRAFLAFRRDTLRFLDFFGARGLLAVLRRDLDREDFLLEPRGAAARRRFFEDRLFDREREREVDIERERDLEAALGLLADRLRDFRFAFLTFRADLRLVDRLLEALRSRLPVNLSLAVF